VPEVSENSCKMRLGAEFSACDVTMHKAYKVALTHQADVEQTTQPIIHFSGPIPPGKQTVN